MTVIEFSKVLLLGCGGALGYYFIMSYVFQLFPMPLFLYANTFLEAWQAKQQKTTRALARIAKGILNILLVLVWLLIFAGFAYLLYFAVQYYFPFTRELFWLYYGSSLSVPALWVGIRSILFFKKKPTQPLKIEVDDRPLLEQIVNS